MNFHHKDKLHWLTFDLFAECQRLVHGVFLRHGGVSAPPYASLNCGYHTEDSLKSTETNRRRALAALGLAATCASLSQKHGKEIVVVSKPFPHIDRCLASGDGLCTDLTHQPLMVKHADCQAAIFYDPLRHALALVHSGWRGSVQNIYQKTVEKMHALYGSQPENLLAAISPSLGPEAAEFRHYREELPPAFHAFQSKPTYFDFWQITRWQLEQAGLLPHHIEIASLCTYSNPIDWFSHRRAKITGRHATIAALL